MTTKRSLSSTRRAAGAKGLRARWGGRSAKATACLRVYPDDAAEIRKLAKIARKLPADVVAALVKQADLHPPERPQGSRHDFIIIDDPQPAVKTGS